MTKKVLMLCKYEHDLNYFKSIKKYIEDNYTNEMKVDVIFNMPFFLIEFLFFFKSLALTKQEISEAIYSEIKRKKIKYNPFIAFLYILLFNISARLYYVKYYSILQSEKYDLLCIWGGYNAFQRIAILCAKKLNIKVYHFENGVLPNTVAMDNKGTNFNNSVPRNRSFYNNIDFKFTPTPLVARDDLKKSQSIKLPNRYIFCPFQVAIDNQILTNSPWISNMIEFYSVLETLCKDTPNDLFFVIKMHPNCNQNYDVLYKKNNPKILFANQNFTEELIEKAEFIITINSTVGVEGIMKNKKIITLGNAFYSGYGFAKDARSIEQILYLLEDETWETDLEANQKFLAYLQNIYLVQGSWQHPSKEHFQEIYERLKL